MAAGTALCLFLIGPHVFSGFSVLDDHTVIGWLGKDIWSRIASTELVQYGFGARYRPVMYLALIGESLIFGGHPMPYHIVQLVWFGVFLSAFAWAALRSVGLVAGLLLLLLAANGHYWANIWTHSLFAAEQTGSFGLGLVIFGCVSFCNWFINRWPARLDTAVLLVSAGALVCVGSKENFLPLIPLNIALIVVAERHKVITRATLAAALVLVCLQAAICYGILHANLTQLSNTNPGGGVLARLAAIFHTKRYALRIALAWAGGLTAGAMAWNGRNARATAQTRRLTVFSGLLLWCGLYACWEQFFYDGMLPKGYRYDFPALFIDPILLGAFFYTLVGLRARFDAIGRQISPLALHIVFAELCLIFVLWPATQLSFNHDSLFPVRSAVRVSGEHSATMMRDLERLRQVVVQHPDWPIILRVSRPGDYEAVLTFPIWLNYAGVKNPASIEVDMQKGSFSSAEAGMAAEIRNRSESGVPGQYVARDASILEAEKNGTCYMAQFTESKSGCVPLPYDPGAYYPAVPG